MAEKIVRMLNVAGNPISGSMVMKYGKYELSISTAFVNLELCIYENDNNVTKELTGMDSVYPSLENLTLIKQIIDNRTKLY